MRLQARGKVAKHPARGPASQPGATPTSLPASQISNQPARQSLNKSAVQKPFKQLWLPDTVSLSLVLSIYLYLSPSLSPSLPLSPSVCRTYTGGGNGRRQASNQERARRQPKHVANQTSSWRSMGPYNQQQTPAARRCFPLSLSLSLSLSPSLSLGKLPEGIVRQGGIQAGGLLNRGGGRRGVKADRQPAWRATMHP